MKINDTLQGIFNMIAFFIAVGAFVWALAMSYSSCMGKAPAKQLTNDSLIHHQ